MEREEEGCFLKLFGSRWHSGEKQEKRESLEEGYEGDLQCESDRDSGEEFIKEEMRERERAEDCRQLERGERGGREK